MTRGYRSASPAIRAAARPRHGRRVGDLVDHGVGVAEPDEDRLVGARRHRHALGEHRLEERRVAGLVGALGPGEVDRRRDVTAHDAEDRADHRQAGGKARRRARVAQQRGEPARPGRELHVDVRRQLAERGEPRRRGDRVARQRPGVEHGAERRERLA